MQFPGVECIFTHLGQLVSGTYLQQNDIVNLQPEQSSVQTSGVVVGEGGPVLPSSVSKVIGKEAVKSL